MPVDFETLIVQSILDLLVHRAASLLPGVAAGVTLSGHGRTSAGTAASSARAARLERTQSELGQGPAVVARRMQTAVVVDDIGADRRFRGPGGHALAADAAAAYSFPLRHGNTCLGALTLSRTTPGPLDARACAKAQDLADVAAAHLLSAAAREEALAVSDGFRDSSLHDALTGLPNRVLLQQHLAHAGLRAKRSHGTVAVLFADLDRFKNVNDTYGHAVGDQLLVSVAGRLGTLMRPGDTLARVSGDEFVFLCEDLLEPGDAQRLAERIATSFLTPFVIEGMSLFASASVGIAYAGPGEMVTGHLLVDADIAMYQAKREGGGAHRVIDLRDAQDAHDRTQLEQDLHGAMARKEFALAYQPIVSSLDGQMIGVEALLRWTHPLLGPVSAATAVSVAERTGLIASIGLWALERSCLDRQEWLRDHPTHPMTMSVNVSALQLMQPGFTTAVRLMLATTDMDPSALILEMTEGIFIEDADRAMAVLVDLKTLGLRLALDDFGTGYCSLSYLRRFPVDMVKIDQQFVADIGQDAAGVAIVTAVTNLAHALGMAVTAEGIETMPQRRHIGRIGCDYSQGYYYARPMTSAAIAAHLELARVSPLRLPVSTGAQTPVAAASP